MINYEYTFNNITQEILKFKKQSIYSENDIKTTTAFVNYLYNFFNYNVVDYNDQKTTDSFDKMLNIFHQNIIYDQNNTILVDLKIINIKIHTLIYKKNKNTKKSQEIIKNIYHFFNYKKQKEIDYLLNERKDIFNAIINSINKIKLYNRYIKIDLNLELLIDLNLANLSYDYIEKNFT